MQSRSPRTGRPARPGRQAVILAAEQFLIDTCEAVVPDLPAAVLMEYLVDYRAHLAAVVAASSGPTPRGGSSAP